MNDNDKELERLKLLKKLSQHKRRVSEPKVFEVKPKPKTPKAEKESEKKTSKKSDQAKPGRIWPIVLLLLVTVGTIVGAGIGWLVFYFFFMLPARVEIALMKPETNFNVAGAAIYYRPTPNGQDIVLYEIPGGKPHLYKYEEFPKEFIDCLVALEDKRYWEHGGIDYYRIVGAAIDDLFSGSFKEGASTLSQQLARMIYLSQKKTLPRKLYEAALARALERAYTKEQLLAFYMSYVGLGVRSNAQVFGFIQASKDYYGLTLAELCQPEHLAERASLIGMLKDVGKYNPATTVHQESVRARRAQVLKTWKDANLIFPVHYDAALAATVQVVANKGKGSYIIDAVMDELKTKGGRESYLEYKVYSTIHPVLQRLLEESVAAQRATIEKLFPGVQIAVVVMDPTTGDVLAMVGGWDYSKSPLDRTKAMRQPGSVAKPVVYATAFGVDDFNLQVQPQLYFDDVPSKTFTFDGKSYEVSNYKNEGSGGQMTAGDALIHSRNVITMEIAQRVGISNIVNTASRLGLVWPAYPSIALGTAESTPRQIASVYSVFANRGARVIPRFVHSVKDGAGKDLLGDRGTVVFQPERFESVLDPAVCDTITDILCDVPSKGTGTIIRTLKQGKEVGYRGKVAVKTGSSRDGVMAAYTPRVVLAGYTGRDKFASDQVEITGNASVGRVFADLLMRMSKNDEVKDLLTFEAPPPQPFKVNGHVLGGTPGATITPLATPATPAEAAPGVITIPDGPLGAKPSTTPTPAPVSPPSTQPGIITIPDGPVQPSPTRRP